MMMMKDNFVHYHAFPRYDKEVEKFNSVWKDEDWPGAINFKEGIILEDDKIDEIKNYMKD
jgi:hypothetical protein